MNRERKLDNRCSYSGILFMICLKISGNIACTGFASISHEFVVICRKRYLKCRMLDIYG